MPPVMNRQQKLDKAQNAIISATKRILGERIAQYAAAFIQRYGGAFDLRTFLQTGKVPLLVSLPPDRQQIFDAGTSAYINATWTHVNEKDRYRIVLMPAFILDAGAATIPQIVHQQIDSQMTLLIKRRSTIQTEAMRRFNIGNAPAAQGTLAAGAAEFSDLNAHVLDAELLHMGLEERLRNPFDTLQPNEQFTIQTNNLTGTDAAGAFNNDVFATLQGMALDIVTG